MSKLWLIIPASLALLFSAPCRPIFSDPAKSTRFNFPTLERSSPVGVDFLTWTVMEKTEWDQLEWGLNFVKAICRRSLLLASVFEPFTATSSSPWIKTPRFVASSNSMANKSWSSLLYSSVKEISTTNWGYAFSSSWKRWKRTLDGWFQHGQWGYPLD